MAGYSCYTCMCVVPQACQIDDRNQNKGLALATSDSFANLSSSSCGCIRWCQDHTTSMKPIQFNLSKIDNLSAEHNYLIQINTNQIRPWRNQRDSFMKCIDLKTSCTFACVRAWTLQLCVQVCAFWCWSEQSNLSSKNMSRLGYQRLFRQPFLQPLRFFVRRSNFHNQNPSRSHGKSTPWSLFQSIFKNLELSLVDVFLWQMFSSVALCSNIRYPMSLMEPSPSHYN